MGTVMTWVVCLGPKIRGYKLVITLLEVSEKEEGVVAIHLPIGPLKTCSGLEAGSSPVVRAFAHGAIGRRIDPS